MISSCIQEAFLDGRLAKGYDEAFTPFKSFNFMSWSTSFLLLLYKRMKLAGMLKMKIKSHVSSPVSHPYAWENVFVVKFKLL